MVTVDFIERSKLRARSLKTQFRCSVLANLRRSYPENVDAAKAIFIHVPKTAGGSFYKLIGYTRIGHVSYRWYEARDPDKFRRYFKFSFVRNPWDRLVSAFFYLKKGGCNAMDKQWALSNISQYDTFESFVEGWINEENIEKYFHFIPQHKFVCDEALTLKVDYLGRFETIQTDFDAIAAKLCIEHQLPHVNKSQRQAYQTYYTDRTRDIVQNVYRTDIERFKYSFE